jgi:hypothetical protein
MRHGRVAKNLTRYEIFMFEQADIDIPAVENNFINTD